jgi:hypothetical protein
VKFMNAEREDVHGTAAPEAPATRRAPRERLSLGKLSIAELQTMYREVVGRDTGSDNKDYLMWKIREAKRGNVRVGPAHAHEPRGPQQILSVRVDEASVPLLDAAWRKHGLRSRNDLVLRALSHELAALGEADSAESFAAMARIKP